jgi:hypothetical protein
VTRTTNLLEPLFVEERRRLKIVPNGFGEKPVLKLIFGALHGIYSGLLGRPDGERASRIPDQDLAADKPNRGLPSSADLFLLSSRLDPLPNVAIDELTMGLPVLCFEKTSGIADFMRCDISRHP